MFALFATLCALVLCWIAGQQADPSSTAVVMPVRLAAGVDPPSRAHSTDAGVDLRSAENTVVPARGHAVISTGMQMKLPEGTFGRIESRSGLSATHGVEVGAGVIDAGYTGVVSIVLHNHGDAAFEVKRGDRIAQLIVLPVVLVRPVVMDEDEWDAATEASTRGRHGFGSTGVRSGDSGLRHRPFATS